MVNLDAIENKISHQFLYYRFPHPFDRRRTSETYFDDKILPLLLELPAKIQRFHIEVKELQLLILVWRLNIPTSNRDKEVNSNFADRPLDRLKLDIPEDYFDGKIRICTARTIEPDRQPFSRLHQEFLEP
jgi:hypothetical protein